MAQREKDVQMVAKPPVPFERDFEKLGEGDGYIAFSFGILFLITLFITLKSVIIPTIFWSILILASLIALAFASLLYFRSGIRKRSYN